MNTELINISKDLSEVGIDSVTGNGLLKDLPIVGTAISLAKLGRSVRDHFFLKKIGIFLHAMAKSDKQRDFFLSKLSKRPKFQNRLNELIPIYLDSYDDKAKARYLGILLVACLKNEITQDVFFRIAHFLQNCFWKDLELLEHRSEQKFIDLVKNNEIVCPNAPALEGLASTVATNPIGQHFGHASDPIRSYSILPLGITFCEILDKYNDKL